MTGRTARWPVSAAAVVLAPTLLAGCQPDPQVGASTPGPVASRVGASATATPRPTASSTPSTGGKTLTGTVRWVLDGDTFDLRDKAKQNHRVRLLGIDAPELDTDDAKAQCGAATAKKALAKLLPAGTSVTVSFDPRADTNNDGMMDRRTEFAKHVKFCHSLLAMQNGVLACTETQIVFLKDTNNDNVADLREVWFDGFTPAHPQMQIGCPRYGFDNWIYLTYGHGKEIGRAHV